MLKTSPEDFQRIIEDVTEEAYCRITITHTSVKHPAGRQK